jgi:chromosome segregation ATPase
MVTDAEMAEMKRRMDKLQQTKKDLQAKRDRYLGHVEAAEQALKTAEAACREKGIDPDQIDEVLQKLVERYNTQLAAAEEAIAKIQTDFAAMESDV